jgi:serine/threonine protein kinase
LSVTDRTLEPLSDGEELAPGLTVIEHLSRNYGLDVYDAWDADRYCRCIAKTVRPDQREDRRIVGRLRGEGALLERLSHPHIVRCYETREDPQPIVVLETLSGRTLDHLIVEGTRRLTADQVALLGIHLTSAVRYLHRAGILHLDLKPANLIIDQGFIKLFDLSLSNPPGPGRRGVGTPAYLSPEQALGDPFTAATDVWGIGSVLFEAATRALPFPKREGDGYPQETMRAVPVGSLRPRLPRALANTIDGCLTHEPAGRPSVEQVLEALETLA